MVINGILHRRMYGDLADMLLKNDNQYLPNIKTTVLMWVWKNYPRSDHESVSASISIYEGRVDMYFSFIHKPERGVVSIIRGRLAVW